MDKKALIETIAPLYNYYKENKDKISPVEALEIMWDIGDHIKSFLDSHKVKPHALYREIYGKAEGSKNITQKSYITREFQGRCFRIRNLFTNKAKIRIDFPHLNNFTVFREAMPFLDNPKYILKGAEKENLLNILNSNFKPAILLKRIRSLQKEKINKKNPRTQKLHELEDAKQHFINFYNYIYSLIDVKNYELAMCKINNIAPQFIRELAKITASLCQEGLKAVKIVPPTNLDQIWLTYYNDVDRLINQKDAKQRRRFRRIMPPQRIIRLADMLYALLDQKLYENFK